MSKKYTVILTFAKWSLRSSLGCFAKFNNFLSLKMGFQGLVVTFFSRVKLVYNNQQDFKMSMLFVDWNWFKKNKK